MSLEEFAKELESISGVSNTRKLENGILQVVWTGEPADYSSHIRELRNNYPSVIQVSPPADGPGNTSDKMPIEYYSEDKYNNFL